VELLERETLRFISLLLWPPNSPDLNPVDYSVWSISLLQEKVYKTRITDLDDFKHCIRTEWTKLDHEVIAAAVHQWRRRLSACVSRAVVILSTAFNSDIVFFAITAAFEAFIH